MEELTAYKANDGTLYESAEKCQEYEVSLVWRKKLDEFKASVMATYSTAVQEVMIDKIIISWEYYKMFNGNDREN